MCPVGFRPPNRHKCYHLELILHVFLSGTARDVPGLEKRQPTTEIWGISPVVSIRITAAEEDREMPDPNAKVRFPKKGSGLYGLDNPERGD